MKLSFKYIVLIMSVFFASCSDSNEDYQFAKPEINKLVIGHDNSMKVRINSDLHLEADIKADAKIDKIIVIIHPEEEHDHSVKSSHDEWELEIVYDEFNGLKNTVFHKHIDVPANAELGEYHFHISVIDLEGNKVELNKEFEVLPIKE